MTSTRDTLVTLEINLYPPTLRGEELEPITPLYRKNKISTCGVIIKTYCSFLITQMREKSTKLSTIGLEAILTLCEFHLSEDWHEIKD